VPLSRAGVLGWPVHHSRSPAMHEAGYAAAGLEDWRYQLLPVPPDLFAETVRALPGAGFVGANVTIPHKEAALALADEATGAARASGAANVLTFRDGKIDADNTDAPAVLAALQDVGYSPAGDRALVLGAGGSARAAIWALREAGAAEVLMWNRTPERGRAVAEELGARPVESAEPAALLVNCTSIGLDPDDDPFAALPLAADALAGYACVVDLAYGADETRLVAAARAAGSAVVDGLDVLIAQGALSFEQWTGHQAPVAAMRAAARGV
jgi:shikimate dehydrogenase